MSDKQQDTRVRALLILVILVLAGGIIWYVGRAKDNTDKTIDNTRRVQQSDDNAANKEDQFKGMKDYNWEAQKVSLKHPDGWTVEENKGLSRLYLKNKDVDLLKEETPADFQQVWLSYDVHETAKAREDAIKQGTSNFRVVSGDVKSSTVKADGVTINVYEYETVGGPTLEAYWTNSKKIRFLATTSTEVGEKNQTAMVAVLKKVLASLNFAD